MNKGQSSNEKLHRKTVERNRRIHMKNLCSKLTSLIPPHHFNSSKGMVSLHDQLDQAATYIKQLKQRVEELKGRTEAAMSNNNDNNTRDTRMCSFELPVVELKELGSVLALVVITGLDKKLMVCEVIRVLEDEGAEVVSSKFSNVGDRVFHTLHAQARVSRVGVDTSRICQRLQELIC